MYRVVSVSAHKQLKHERARAGMLLTALVVAMMPLAGLINMLTPTDASAAITTTTSFRNPTTCASVAGIGTRAWTAPGNATATDGALARARLNTATSRYLRCSGFGFTIPTNATIYGVTVSVVHSAEKPGQTTYSSLMKASALAGTTKSSTANWLTAPQTTSYGGGADLWGTTWTAADINNVGFGYSTYVTSSASGNTRHNIDSITMAVTYGYNPAFSQGNYQWFTNANSTSVGAPLNGVAQNTPTTSVVGSGIFRLRILVRVDGDIAPAGLVNFKLQYALRGADNACDTSFVGETYQDVTTTSAIAYADNPAPADGQAITASTSPTDGTRTIIPQEYNELNNTGIVTNIPSGQAGLWDFALKDRADSYGSTYCLRMVNATGVAFPTYLQIPQISTAAGTVNVGFVSSAGATVTNPSFAFPEAISAFACQAGVASFGTSSTNHLRVTQTGNAGAGWSVSIAPTGGSTALWSAGPTGPYYDFNDGSGSPPGCLNGSDGDVHAGQLSLNLSGASVVPQAGCSASGVSLGAASGAYTPTISALTLLSATSAAQSSCYFGLSGATFKQMIPPNRVIGSYSLNMTVTVTSL